jgi:hypothetical protein
MKQKLTESDIKLLISGSGMSLLDNQSSLNIIANYLNELVGPLITKHITDSNRLKFAFTNVEVIPTAKIVGNHYLDVLLRIRGYKSKYSKNKNSHSAVASVSINELFGNCSTVCISKIHCDNISNAGDCYPIMTIAEHLSELMGYSNLIYTTSSNNYENGKLKVYFNENNWNVIDSFKNVRGGNIEIHTKKINLTKI